MHRFKKNTFFCFVHIKWLKLLKKHGKRMLFKKWLNETNIKDRIKHSNLAAATLQYSSEPRKRRQELQDCGNYQPCRRFLEEDFAMQIIMDCRKTPVNFKTKLGFNQDPVMNQEQSVL